jgi:ABC-2 type transport system permease protein
VIGIVGLVAIVVTAVRAQTGENVVTYSDFPEVLTLLIILFCTVVGPELVSRDLHSGVLPLYFSRPLRRSDYPLAKLAALISAAFLMLGGAQLLMFLVAAFNVEKFGDVWGEFGSFAAGVAYSALHAAVFASVALYVASLISRRAVAAAAIAGVFLVTTPVVGVLVSLPSTTANELAGLASPATVVSGVGDWLFETSGEQGIGGWGPLYAVTAVAIVAAAVLLLLARYRKVAK